MSSRSLQRCSVEENTSHSAILKTIRIREACHFLSETGHAAFSLSPVSGLKTSHLGVLPLPVAGGWNWSPA
jgi:hypothetical protein